MNPKKLALIVSIFSFFNSQLLFAEDALTSLQRDVELAKQKNQLMLGQLNTARNSMDKIEKQKTIPAAAILKNAEIKTSVPSAQLKKDPSSDFNQKIIQEPYSRVNTAIPLVDKDSPIAAVDFSPNKGQSIQESFGNKLQTLPNFLFGVKRPASLIDGKHPTLKTPDGKITEGITKFKVAISDNKITVEEAVDIAIANDTKLKSLEKNMEVTDAQLTEARRALFPTVQIESTINGGKIAGSGGRNPYRGTSKKINVSQPLYYGGELTNSVKQAQENFNAAKAEYFKAKDDFIHGVRVSYYGAVKAQYNAIYQQELLERVSQIYDAVRAQKEAGVISDVDYLNVESQYQQASFQVEASNNDLLSTHIDLKQVMNLDVDGLIPVDTKLSYSIVKPSLDDLLNKAFQSNPDIRSKAYALEAARYGIDIVDGRKKPRFDLRGSYGALGEAFRDGEGHASVDPEKEWFIGLEGNMPLGPNSIDYEQNKHVYGPTVLSLNGSEDWKSTFRLNLFDKLGLITDEKRAEFEMLQAEESFKDSKNEVSKKLREEYFSLQRYMIQIHSSQAKMDYENKQLSILDYLLSIQETSPSNYIETLLEWVQDRYAFVQAVADYNVSLSALGLYIGDSSYFDEQIKQSTEKYEVANVA